MPFSQAADISFKTQRCIFLTVGDMEVSYASMAWGDKLVPRMEKKGMTWWPSKVSFYRCLLCWTQYMVSPSPFTSILLGKTDVKRRVSFVLLHLLENRFVWLSGYGENIRWFCGILAMGEAHFTYVIVTHTYVVLLMPDRHFLVLDFGCCYLHFCSSSCM